MTTRQNSLTKEWDELGQNQPSTSAIQQSAADGQQLDSAGNVAPIHLRRLNSSSSLNLDGRLINQSPKSAAVTKSKSSTRSNSNWWSVDDLSYPGIPFQVARYLCETSPDLLDSMAATLHDAGGMKHRHTPRTQSKLSSPLLHLSMTTDALSLQESVIDGCKNIPNEVVTTSDRSSTANSAHSDADLKSFTVVTDADVSRGDLLRRVPFEMITKTVEKRSWYGPVSPKDEDLPSSLSQFASSEELRREDSRSLRLELKSAASDIGSTCELDSNYELQSNISETSGFEEEMFRIKKLLLDASSPRSVNGEDSAHQQLDLLREKAALEGRVEALALELNQMMNERSQLLNELNSTKTQLQTKSHYPTHSVQSETIRNLETKLKESENKAGELEEFVSKLQAHIEANSEEIIHTRAELKENEAEIASLKSSVGELKVEAELKEGAVRGLKSKVAELHVKLESAMQSKSIVEGDLHAVRAQVGTEQEMKDWYRTQLQQTQAAKSKLQQELIALSATVAETESTAERMRFERDQCKRNLAETQRKAVSEKESLLRQLESIEADVQERESAFRELQRDACAVDEAVLNGMKKIDEERALLTEEKFEASELRRQLELAQLDSEMRLSTVRKMETEAAQFMKQLTVLQKTVSEKELELHQAHESYMDLEATQKEQQATLLAKSEVIEKLRQEKVAVEVQLSGAREEKRELDGMICEVKDNVVKIDSRTRNMREELNAKTETINSLERQNSELKAEVKRLLEAEEKLKTKLYHVEDELLSAQEELSGRRVKEPRLQDALNTLSDQLTQLQGENALLKDKISILEKYNINANRNVTAESSLENENMSKEHLRDDEQLQSLINSLKEAEKKSQRFESNVKVLTRKLRETLKSKTSVEAELKQLKATSNGVSEAVNVSKTKDAKIIYYRKKLVAMETKLNESLQLYEDERRRADKNQESLLELERQKGKLHALADSSSALKQQTTHLEATLSVTEETVSQLHQLNSDIVAKKQEEEEELKAALKDLEAKLKMEQNTVREARKLLYKEKCESAAVRKHLTSARASIDELNGVMSSKEAQIAEVESEVERQRLTLIQSASEAAELRSRLSKCQEMVEKLQKEVEESRAKDPLLADQIKTLGWHVQQKKQELSQVQQQYRMCEERQSEEVRRVNELLSEAHRGLEAARRELHATLQEKLALQAKVGELRATIRSVVDKSRTDQRIPDSPSPCDEHLISHLLQQSLPLPHCRPLSNLQVCVNTLKQEMAILQQQLLDEAV